MPDDPLQPKRRKETTEQIVKRLTARIAAGELHLRSELAETLLRAAQESALKEKFADALDSINEAVNVLRQLVKEGQHELNTFIGRGLLFRAALTRFHKGPEAGLLAFNEAIKYLMEENISDDPAAQNELAVALMTKADVLIEPLGAYAAAQSSQEQAAAIWQRLVDLGGREFRIPLINALTACGDSKVQNGDIAGAILALQRAAEYAEECMEEGENAAQPFLVQALLKLTRLYEQSGNMDKAFETVRTSIRTVNKLIAAGFEQAGMMFTALYLEHGMLYEKIRKIPEALAEFDRCRQVFADMYRQQQWGDTESYMIRTGMANVLMCRGNMLAELNRFDEAADAYEESVWQYQCASDMKQPRYDPTFISYSIGVVQLNHANMLVVQGKIKEGVQLMEQAVKALRRRYDSGHTEVLANVAAGYRKMANIWQLLRDTTHVFVWFNKLIRLLESAVDDGKIEFRGELAFAYRQRSALWDEIRLPESSLEDIYKAKRLFRTIADEDRETADIHNAKVQWGELMLAAAVILVKTERTEKALQFLHEEIADIVRFYEEGNEHVIIDVLMGYSQFADFAETFVKRAAATDYPADKTKTVLISALEYCRRGIVLSQKKMPDVSKNLFAQLFLTMKTALFYKMSGTFAGMLKKYEEAGICFASSVDHWKSLLSGLERVKAKDKFEAAEQGKPMLVWSVPGTGSDPYQDRYLFYMQELRITMQMWAKACLQCSRKESAERLFREENEMTREMYRNGLPNADRYLIMSLLKHAELALFLLPPEEAAALPEEALDLLRKRFESGDIDTEDYHVMRQLLDVYAVIIRPKLFHHAKQTADIVSAVMDGIKNFPPPEMWIELCKRLELPCKFRQATPELKEEIYSLQQRLIEKYPHWETVPKLKRYRESVTKKRISQNG
ncbi:MAG: hypothetical protein LBH00_03870 [Planctomycetaceae bacterium]|jgi:tetratricopeptide (TPR) repeat protein|nr:hypothetical protein [Planctomycetaceae bacterium]